jgi:hypothetical protein
LRLSTSLAPVPEATRDSIGAARQRCGPAKTSGAIG